MPKNGNGINGYRYKADQIAQAITDANGILSLAARNLGCSRTTLYKYVKKYATVQEALEEARETNIDFVESSLMKQIKKGNVTAMIFFLKTQGKHRGWVERQEVAGVKDAPLVIVNWDEATNDSD
jgi:hypothetical protein